MRAALALLALLTPSTAAAMRDLPTPPRALEKCTSGDFSATPQVQHRNALQLPKGTGEDRPACTAIASGSAIFLQRDPNGYEDSVNLYAGMRWDPINNRDPTGRGIGEDLGRLVEQVCRRGNDLPQFVNVALHAFTLGASTRCQAPPDPTAEQVKGAARSFGGRVGRATFGEATRLFGVEYTNIAPDNAVVFGGAGQNFDAQSNFDKQFIVDTVEAQGADAGQEVGEFAGEQSVYAASGIVAGWFSRYLGSAIVGEGVATNVSTPKTEVFYRAVSKKEWARIQKGRGLFKRSAGTSELGVTRDESYALGLGTRKGIPSRKYPYVVEFTVEAGTEARLLEQAAAHPSALSTYPTLPRFTSGTRRPQVKFEKGGIQSLLLGYSDEALDLFNRATLSIRRVR